MTRSAARAKNLQSVIQFMISHGCVNHAQFNKVASKILSPSDDGATEEEISKLFHDTNKLLIPYNMMIRSATDNLTQPKENYYVLISTVDNDITHAATRYHPKQVEFFKHLLQSIVNEPASIIPYTGVRSCAEKAQLPSSTTKYRSIKHECETLFREWTTKKWFKIIEENKKEFVALGVRSMAELDVFIDRQTSLELKPDIG